MTGGPVYEKYDILPCAHCKDSHFWFELRVHDLLGVVCDHCFEEHYCREHDEEWRDIDGIQVCPDCVEEFKKDKKETSHG